jgi:hypothetical protein
VIQLKRLAEQGDPLLPVSAPGQDLPGVLECRGQGERPYLTNRSRRSCTNDR